MEEEGCLKEKKKIGFVLTIGVIFTVTVIVLVEKSKNSSEIPSTGLPPTVTYVHPSATDTSVGFVKDYCAIHFPRITLLNPLTNHWSSTNMLTWTSFLKNMHGNMSGGKHLRDKCSFGQNGFGLADKRPCMLLQIKQATSSADNLCTRITCKTDKGDELEMMATPQLQSLTCQAIVRMPEMTTDPVHVQCKLRGLDKNPYCEHGNIQFTVAGQMSDRLKHAGQMAQ